MPLAEQKQLADAGTVEYLVVPVLLLFVILQLTTAPEEVVTKGVLRKAQKSYDRKLVGVISTAPGVTLGSIDSESGQKDSRALALTGRVPVKIDPDSDPIEIGDFLTSSDTPGLAKKATKIGYTIGKALESWECSRSSEPIEGSELETVGCKEKIEVFVNLGLYMGEISDSGVLKLAEAIDIELNEEESKRIEPAGRDPEVEQNISLNLKDTLLSILEKINFLEERQIALEAAFASGLDILTDIRFFESTSYI